LKNKSSDIENLLIILVKNPVIGKVKTRLAKSIGFENAMSIYQFLIKRVAEVTENIAVDKLVLYSDFVQMKDEFPAGIYGKGLQHGNDIGEKMNSAFDTAFKKGYKNVALIGSDVISLSEDVITSAFENLKTKDVVFGPAQDGGYYLIGMSRHCPIVFNNIKWSTEDVLKQSIYNCKQQELQIQLLKTLSDFDRIEDAIYLEEKDIQLLEKELLGFISKGFKKLAV
jgi:hypothetical protein